MARFAVRLVVHYGDVVHSAADRVRALFPLVYVHGAGSAPARVVRGRGNERQREDVHQELHRRLHGGRGHCADLFDLLGVFVEQRPGSGRQPARRHNGVGVYRSAHF